MRQEHLYEPFEISIKTLDECPKLDHRHSFFELVYILSGTGQHSINEHTFGYHSGHMFLVTPQDVHFIDVETTTQFLFLRFNEIYIKSNSLKSENIKLLEFILRNASHQPDCILKNREDKVLVRAMVEGIIKESVNRDLYGREIIQQLVNTLIAIVARNIAKRTPNSINEKSNVKIIDILDYIQHNIYEPEKIRAKALSTNFGISEFYLGKFFKKSCNETLQSYINNYRIMLIEHRLKHSDKRINEIVAELGFVDESHLNKFFRRQKGMSPKEFRAIHKISLR